MTRILPLAAAAAALLAPASALAFDIQDDIKACAAEAEREGILTEGAYTLRFVSDKGNRNRTLVVEAITGPDESLTVECKMKRSEMLGASVAE